MKSESDLSDSGLCRRGELACASPLFATSGVRFDCVMFTASVKRCTNWQNAGATGFRGRARAGGRGTVPRGLYESSILVGATNVPEILDVEGLARNNVSG